jgi:hypothetical protein
MMVAHESGHVLHAAVSGGRVVRVVLDPLAFSRTDVSPNPHPVFVAWGGMVWGALLPTLAWLIAWAARWRLAFLLRFWAGFCLLANGVYAETGAMVPAGDAEDLLRMGVPRQALVLVGAPLAACGLMLWNGLAPRFGLAGSQGPERGAVWAAAGALAVLLAGMTAWTVLRG